MSYKRFCDMCGKEVASRSLWTLSLCPQGDYEEPDELHDHRLYLPDLCEQCVPKLGATIATVKEWEGKS